MGDTVPTLFFRYDIFLIQWFVLAQSKKMEQRQMEKILFIGNSTFEILTFIWD